MFRHACNDRRTEAPSLRPPRKTSVTSSPSGFKHWKKTDSFSLWSLPTILAIVILTFSRWMMKQVNQTLHEYSKMGLLKNSSCLVKDYCNGTRGNGRRKDSNWLVWIDSKENHPWSHGTRKHTYSLPDYGRKLLNHLLPDRQHRELTRLVRKRLNGRMAENWL